MLGLNIHSGAPRGAGPRATDEEVGRALALYFNIRDTSAPGFGRLMASAKTMVVTQGIPSGQLDALRSLMVNLSAEAAREGFATSPQAQAQFTNANIHGADFANAEARGLLGQQRPGVDGSLLALAAARLAGSASSTTYGTSLSGVAGPLATPAYWNSVGINTSIGRQLNALGFVSQAQVQQVVRDSGRLGLSPNEGAVPAARLRKAEGPRADAHIDHLEQYRRDMEAQERARLEALRRNDHAAAARIEEDMRRRREETERYRDREVATPDGRSSFDDLRRRTEQRALERASRPVGSEILPSPDQGTRLEGTNTRPLATPTATSSAAIAAASPSPASTAPAVVNDQTRPSALAGLRSMRPT